MQLILVKCFQDTTGISQYRTCIFNPHQYIREITHEQTQEIIISWQMTIVGKRQVSYLTYFTLVKELKDRRVWFHSCVRNSYLILDCLQSVFFFRTPQTYCIEYKGEGLRRQGYWKKSLLESFFFLFHAWLINLKCLAKNMCARYTEVVTRSVQYKNAKILDTRQLR